MFGSVCFISALGARTAWRIVMFQPFKRHHFPASAVSVPSKSNLFQIQNVLWLLFWWKLLVPGKNEACSSILLSFAPSRCALHREFWGYPRAGLEGLRSGSPSYSVSGCKVLGSTPQGFGLPGSSRKLLDTEMSPSWLNLPSLASVPPWEGRNRWLNLDFFNFRKKLCYFGNPFTRVHFSLPSLHAHWLELRCESKEVIRSSDFWAQGRGTNGVLVVLMYEGFYIGVWTQRLWW